MEDTCTKYSVRVIGLRLFEDNLNELLWLLKRGPTLAFDFTHEEHPQRMLLFIVGGTRAVEY
jgi:hypothetical protein